MELLSAYYDNRNKGAYSSKARIANLKKLSEAVSYLETKGLYTADDLDAALHTMQDKIDTLKKSVSGKQARIKELDELLCMADYSRCASSGIARPVQAEAASFPGWCTVPTAVRSCITGRPTITDRRARSLTVLSIRSTRTSAVLITSGKPYSAT